jgi:hypothetical protein
MLVQRWVEILKNSEDHDMKKDHGPIQTNLAEADTRECFKYGKVAHIASDCRAKPRVMCPECGGAPSQQYTTRRQRFLAIRMEREKKKAEKDKEKKVKEKEKKQKSKKGKRPSHRDKKAYKLSKPSQSHQVAVVAAKRCR